MLFLESSLPARHVSVGDACGRCEQDNAASFCKGFSTSDGVASKIARKSACM